MSTSKRVTFDEYNQPHVIITIVGWDDAFRFAWALGHLQTDFADLGRRVGGSLRRRIGAEQFRTLHQRFTSNERIGWTRGEEDEP